MKTFLCMVVFLVISCGLSAQSELNVAIGQGQLAKVKELVAENPAILDKYIEYNGYPLHMAANKIQPEIVEWMLTQKSKIKANTRDKKGRNAIFLLCSSKYLKGKSCEDAKKILDMLQEAGGDINQADKDGDTPLQLTLNSYTNIPAANLPFIAYLLEKGANPNSKSKEGISPVMSMCKWFNCGSAINAKLNLQKFEIIKALTEHGADLNVPDPTWGKNTPLIVLMSEQRGFFPKKTDKHAVIKFLIENGAKTNFKNKKGQSAKSIAKTLKKKDKELYKVVTKTKVLKKKRKK